MFKSASILIKLGTKVLNAFYNTWSAEFLIWNGNLLTWRSVYMNHVFVLCIEKPVPLLRFYYSSCHSVIVSVSEEETTMPYTVWSLNSSELFWVSLAIFTLYMWC